ncbi:hypothetical protein C2S51_028692 [Perilla frutescens var. frutescens]|nr:hypothetical protein C2S51_028692 [Perilla frutescens var. frutescens]
MRPSLFNGTKAISKPSCCKWWYESSTHLGSVCVVMKWRNLFLEKNRMLFIEILFDSVAPEVKMISFDETSNRSDCEQMIAPTTSTASSDNSRSSDVSSDGSMSGETRKIGMEERIRVKLGVG